MVLTVKLISLSVLAVNVKVGNAITQVFSLDISQQPTYFICIFVLKRDTSKSGQNRTSCKRILWLLIVISIVPMPLIGTFDFPSPNRTYLLVVGLKRSRKKDLLLHM